MNKSYFNKITRNIFSFTFGQLLSLLINLAAIALGARYLGVSDFGIFNYLLATIVIITKLIDMGIAPNIFREYSINKNVGLLNSGIQLRIISFIAFIIIYNIVCILISISKIEIILSNLLLINMVISSKGFLREIMEIPFKVDLLVHFPIIIMLMDNIIFLVLVIIMPIVQADLTYFVLAYTLSNLPGFLIMFFLIKKKYNYQLTAKLTGTRWLIKKSFPVFIYIIFNAAYLNIDLLLLGNLDSSFSAGIYSAAFRLVLPILIVPTAFIHTIFPRITANYHQSPSENPPIIRIAFKIFFALAFSLAAIVTFKADSIISFIYGQNYLSSSEPLIILLWGMVFMFNSFFVINILVAYDKQTGIYIYSIVTLLINVILNFILIEQYSFMGAAYSKFFSFVIGFIITTIVLYKIDNTIYLLEKELLFFSLLIIGLCYFFSLFFSLVFYLIFSFIIVLTSLILSKFFSSYEIKQLLKLINKEKWYKKGFSFFYSE